MKSSYLMSTYCVLGFRGSYCRFKTTEARMLEVLTGQSELGPHSWGAEPLWHQAHIDSMQSLCQSREDSSKCEVGRAVTGLYGSQSSQLVISTLGMRRRKKESCMSQSAHGAMPWARCMTVLLSGFWRQRPPAEAWLRGENRNICCFL